MVTQRDPRSAYVSYVSRSRFQPLSQTNFKSHHLSKYHCKVIALIDFAKGQRHLIERHPTWTWFLYVFVVFRCLQASVRKRLMEFSAQLGHINFNDLMYGVSIATIDYRFMNFGMNNMKQYETHETVHYTHYTVYPYSFRFFQGQSHCACPLQSFYLFCQGRFNSVSKQSSFEWQFQ